MGHVRTALWPRTRHDLRGNRLDLGLALVAKARHPARVGSLPGQGPDRPDHRMAIAEILHAAGQGQIERGGLAAIAVAQEVEAGRMGGYPVVAVGAVLVEQLPVGGNAVLLGIAHGLHALRAVVGDIDEIGLGAGQVFIQRNGIAVEAHEHEAAELVEAFDLGQVERRLLQRIDGMGIRTRHADHLAREVEGPGVIRTGEGPARSGTLPAHHRAAMAAGVVEAVHFPVAVPRQDERPATHFARDERPRLHLRGLCDVQPAFAENAFALEGQNVLVDEGIAVDQEAPRDAIVADGSGEVQRLSHSIPPCRARPDDEFVVAPKKTNAAPIL